MNSERVRLGTAYQRVNLIDAEDHQIMAAERGHRQLRGLLDDRDSVQIQQQPLYVEEADHHIQEVGIMAVREVRYVTEREWKKMIALQKNETQITKYLQEIARSQKRHLIASQIPRNQKGQFVGKEMGKAKPIKSVGRKGRPKKNERDQ